MRAVLYPAAALALLTFCGPGDNRGGGPGGAGDGQQSAMGDTAAAIGDTTGTTGTTGGAAGGATGGAAGGAGDTGAMGGGDTAGGAGAGAGAGGRLDAAGIMSQLSVSNAAEIEASQLAQKHAKQAAVKQIAQRLEADHKKNDQEGKALGKKLGLKPPPETATAAAREGQMPPWADTAQGGNFDQAFVANQIEAHQTNIRAIRDNMLPAADNPQLKAFLQKTVTAMEGHLKQLQQVQQKLGTSS